MKHFRPEDVISALSINPVDITPTETALVFHIEGTIDVGNICDFLNAMNRYTGLENIPDGELL